MGPDKRDIILVRAGVNEFNEPAPDDVPDVGSGGLWQLARSSMARITHPARRSVATSARTSPRRNGLATPGANHVGDHYLTRRPIGHTLIHQLP